jgi:putative restriction endonuclease
MEKRFWTRDEFILVFNLYLQLPFGKMDQRTKEVKELASLIGRTSSAVAMRLVNFASVDPFHQNRGISGLKGGANKCAPIFEEFVENREDLLFESEKILARYQNISIEEKEKEIFSDLKEVRGEMRERIVKTRVNQNLFRKIVLNSYNSKCAITGIDIKELLVASHIKPWSIDEENRLNPSNGICLNTLHDKAFDKGLISINQNYEIIFSKNLKENVDKSYYREYFEPYENKKLSLPERFLPNIEFLEYHFNFCFNK